MYNILYCIGYNLNVLTDVLIVFELKTFEHYSEHLYYLYILVDDDETLLFYYFQEAF